MNSIILPSELKSVIFQWQAHAIQNAVYVSMILLSVWNHGEALCQHAPCHQEILLPELLLQNSRSEWIKFHSYEVQEQEKLPYSDWS